MGLLEKTTSAWPAERWRDVTVLVAVSGGADSVALLRALLELSERGAGRLVAAHFNHRLRGEQSEMDRRFVEELSRSLGVPAVVGAAAEDLVRTAGGLGLEGAARQARYEFFQSAAAQHGARYVATAHTADDQVETVLLNIVRGTGLAGVAGIPRVRPLTEGVTIVRPLLDVTRAEVIDYLQSLGQPYRDDASNADHNFARNRLRHELLPMLEQKFNAQTRQAILRLSQLAGQANDFLETEARAAAETAMRRNRGGVEFDRATLTKAHSAVARQMLFIAWREQGWPLVDMSLEKWEQLLRLARSTADEPAVMFPGAVLARADGEVLRLSRSGVADN